MAKPKRWYSPRIAANLQKTYEQATAEELAEGVTWYERSHEFCEDLAGRYHLPVRSVCGIVAALSPGSEWGRNKTDAETFCEAFSRGARGKELPLVGSYGWANIKKAEKIALGADLLDVFSPRARKVRAFYTCLADPAEERAVCIDRHAKSAALGRKLADNETAVRSEQAYHRLAEHYRRGAQKVSVLPHQFQAVIWMVWKRIGEAMAEPVPF